MQKLSIIALALALAVSVSCNKADKLHLEQLQQDYAALEQTAPSAVPEAATPSADEPGEFKFTLDKEFYGVDAGCSVSIRYSLPQAASVQVNVLEGWSAEVSMREAEGEIVLTAPDPVHPCEMVAVATTADGKTTALQLPVRVRDPYSDATRPRIDALGYYLRTHNRSVENCRKLVDAGINIVTVESEDGGFEELMDMCRQVGLKVLLIIGGYAGRAYDNPDRYYGELEAFVNRMKVRPELYGWHICDEPSLAEAARVKAMKDMVEALDPDHPVYLNYHPEASSGSLGANTYKEYIDTFTDYLDQDLISFDMYPILPGRIMPNWHSCLEVVSDAAKRHGVPFWAFVASCWIDKETLDREKPVAQNELLQAYTSLAYGAQCIQYFTISQYGGTSYAPFMLDGSWSGAYDAMRDANLEMLNRSYIFKDATIRKVRHNNEMANHVTSLTPMDLPQQFNGFASTYSCCFSFVENNGNEYIAIVNNYWNVDQDLMVDANDWYYEIDKDGNFIEHGPGVSYLKVEKGGMTVLKYR